MIGYSSYYSDPQETRGRRWEPRSQHTITPQGIGATPPGGYLSHPPHELGVVPAPPQGGTLRRTEPSQGWASQRDSTSDYNWNQSAPLSAPGIAESSGGSYGFGLFASGSATEEVLEGARIRSMSSEPHGHQSSRNAGDRRIRCSSATRNRQPRPRPNNPLQAMVAEHQHETLSPPRGSNAAPINLSPPSASPPVQRIEYQTSTGAMPTALSARPTTSTLRGSNNATQEFREHGESLAKPLGAGNARTDELGVPGGGSYGYQVPDLEALLTHASPARPANLPMVLASSTRLHNMRRSQETQTAQTNPQLPVRPILPLGIIVNAVFKTRDWLYVRTAHGAEGYVPYRVCLPLGILPPNRQPTSDSENAASGGASPWELRGGIEYSGINSSSASTSRRTAPKSQVPSGSGTASVPQQHRSRQRGRRRANAETSNQTDMQKLQPNTT